ncbi:hypothetical protein C7293_14810 [filamentous cyanobacterium CCT1]|nr:hypothetical protein C7293_14810 [filamentous cyanobacterium CCT1]PSN80366.1 hypothetical protein C8B47_06955 [filamentous cyanobacterium CCP4]
MFHLYFGGFDVLLYLGGIYGAIALSKAICDQMDAADVAQSSTTETTVAPIQPIAPELIAPVTKREEVSVRVSVN